MPTPKLQFLPFLMLALAAAGCAGDRAPAARIQEEAFLKIGGIDQWVTIRGDHADAPLLLLVHGGPGDAQSPLVKAYAPFERDFVLVQWDQRGAGRTFQKLGAATPNLDLEHQVEDGIALAEQLRRRFPDQELILLGHSYGTLIAVGMAKARPELFAAYVGTGQVSRWADSVQFQFDYLKQEAARAGDAATLASLTAIGKPDPADVEQYFGFTKPLRRYMYRSDRQYLAGLKELYLKQPGFQEADFEWLGGGMGFSGPKLIGAIVAEDLYRSAPRLELPVYVIQGRHDVSTPTAPAKTFFDALEAPEKRFVVLEDAGHFALVTHSELFLKELGKLLRH